MNWITKYKLFEMLVLTWTTFDFMSNDDYLKGKMVFDIPHLFMGEGYIPGPSANGSAQGLSRRHLTPKDIISGSNIEELDVMFPPEERARLVSFASHLTSLILEFIRICGDHPTVREAMFESYTESESAAYQHRFIRTKLEFAKGYWSSEIFGIFRRYRGFFSREILVQCLPCICKRAGRQARPSRGTAPWAWPPSHWAFGQWPQAH